MTDSRVTHAAVAVLVRPDGAVLLGQRPQGKPWAGWWEFPGGKIEAGELPIQGLQRELHEELGTEALEVYPWLTRSFDYPEKTVKLHFFMVHRWSAEPHGKEGQALVWQHPDRIEVAPLLPANAPVVKALTLPRIYGITDLAESGEHLFFSRLQAALDAGLRLIEVREKQLGSEALESFARRVMAFSKPYGAKVLINGDVQMACRTGAHGVHLSAFQLMRLTQRPELEWVAASCHDALELQQARLMELDFVTLSPVMPTRSHPGAQTLGWSGFNQLARDYPLPVFALGGMKCDDLAIARQHGAHGIAMQRGVWQP
ncbi:MAG: mutator MutT protein [Pseudomonadota bacterium]|jgi:8-oxo-dGTP diphosphatase